MEKLTQYIPTQPITRFAPSPTGYLHLGHVISMIFVFGMASLYGAKVLLRLEDHDQERYRKEYDQAILDDMAWLGFIPDNWDEFQRADHKTSFRQSQCFNLYRSFLDDLAIKGKIYSCECSRKHLARDQNFDQEDVEVIYPGICRFKNKPIMSEHHGIRLRVENEQQCFIDLRHGQLNQNPHQQCGDFLIKDRRGFYTYNYAVVIDDLQQGVNLIIRGDDLLHCTGRQLALAKQLSVQPPPLYLHHPLALDGHGKKLSKRDHAEGIIKRRENKDNPEMVLGEALFAARIIPKILPIKVKELAEILQGFFKFTTLPAITR